MNEQSDAADAGLDEILNRLLDPVEQLADDLSAPAGAHTDEKTEARPSRVKFGRGENVSATIAIPSSLAKRGGQTLVRYRVLVRCGLCGGVPGTPETNACTECDGSGRVEVDRQLNVTFPPGATNGDELRVRGEGNAAPDGGTPGDLVLFVLLVQKGRLSRLRPPRSG